MDSMAFLAVVRCRPDYAMYIGGLVPDPCGVKVLRFPEELSVVCYKG